MARTHFVLAVLAALALAAPAAAASLKAYPTCTGLLSFYHTNALKRASEFARRPLRRLRKSASPALASAPISLAPVADAPPQAGTDFSDTNVQVAGVDEPDIVKTDGSRVFAVHNRRLTLVRAAAGGARGAIIASLDLPVYLTEMLIEGDTLFLIASDFGALDPGASPTPPPSQFGPGPVRIPLSAPTSRAFTARSFVPFSGEELTVVFRVSAVGDKLRIRDTLHMQGRYISAREVNGVVRLVTSFRPGFSFTYKGPIARGAKAPDAAERAIRNTTLGTWVPRYRLSTPCDRGPKCARIRTGFVVSCSKVYHMAGSFSGFSLLVVTTLRANGEFSPRGSAAVGSEGENVYSTASNLYVATTVYEQDFLTGPRLGANFKTSIHKFQLLPWSTNYAGSGSVSGSVLNQFSMHEYDGVFFVATTVGAPWWRSRDQSKSKITSFRQVQRALKPIGSVGNLGVGERIYAVRYVKKLAYIVTFREIDPLYIVDIANPGKMKVTGELKIPGFSSYLHPIGNGKLLGVGREATLYGRSTGAKVSLFDVSDLTKPRELSAWTLKGSYSSARWDHRAFLYWAPESVAVLPVDVYSEKAGQSFSGSIVLKVVGNKIVSKGRISHPKCCGQFASQPPIDRNFVLGKVNLWSFSQNALQVNAIRTLKFKSIVKLAAA